MSTLYIQTDNYQVRQMLLNMVTSRRSTDSGFDIPMLVETVEQNPNFSLHTFNLRIRVAATNHGNPMPCLLLPRSSLAVTPYRMANSIGLIDQGYRGEVKAKVDVNEPGQHVVQQGSRLFQICQHNFLPWDSVEIVDQLPDANDNRGSGGFGSTN
jgi:dUTPase